MRIKFRVWDKQTKKMIRSPYDAEFNVAIFLPGGDVQLHEKSLEQKWICNDCSAKDKDRRFNCMLYTGINDKSGKEIYEGDIVKTHFRIGYVVYRDGRFLIIDFKTSHNHHVAWNIEILGNIYEDEDLEREYIDVQKVELKTKPFKNTKVTFLRMDKGE